MKILDHINWKHISFQELETLIQIHGDTETSILDDELSNSLTPLCAACKYNREDLVTILLHHGANPQKSCSFYGRQPLHFACDHSNGNLGIVRKILQAKADVNCQDEDGSTGLHLACTESNEPVAKLLLDRGADVTVTDLDGETALVRSCLAHSNCLVEALLQAGSDPGVNDGQPLELAVRLPSVEMLKLLIEKGANVQQGAYLAHASEMNHIDIMKILKNYGADVNKTNTLGMSPLHVACYSSEASTETVSLLLSWGADVHSYSSTRETALHYACAARNCLKVRLLLSYGADPGAQGSHCITPMTACLVSVFQEHQELGSPGTTVVLILRLLLAAGAKLKPDGLQALRSSIALVRSLGSAARQELLHLLESQACQPSSLQDICRRRVRAATIPCKDLNVASLPLPKQIIAYLMFKDIIN